jgi:UDPglucose 6-dehydrogenase
VATNVREERLTFSTDTLAAIGRAEVVFIALGTPTRGDDGQADLRFVYAAAKDNAGLHGRRQQMTVPVGTGDEVENIIRAVRPDGDFAVISNPEFLREGAAIYDFKHPDRIVVGSDDPRAIALMHEAYRPLYLNAAPFLFTARRTAELIKYAANGFLTTRADFINEMADLCEKVRANVQDVARGIGLDNPFARNSCIDACGGSVADKTVAIVGLALKQNQTTSAKPPQSPLSPLCSEPAQEFTPTIRRRSSRPGRYGPA